MGKYRNIPPEIARKLDQSVRRVRRIVAFRGACATLAAAVASLLAIMAVDAMVTIFSPWVRWGLWACGVVATSATAYLSLVKPLSRRFTAGEIAALIERNHPELEERLSTVVELAEQGDAEMSGRLVEALVADAVKDAGSVSPRREFTSRTVKPRFIAAALALLVLGALFALFPSATRRLAARALVPSAEVDNIYASSMRVAPGDVVLLKGSPLTVSLAVDGGFPSRAFVRTRPEGKGEAVERMTRTDAAEGDRAFYEFSYPQVDRSFTYRMNCGSGLTRGYRVEVVDEPSFSGRVIEIEHPAYTGRPADSYTNRADIVGLAGSKVTVTVVPSRAGLEGAAVLPGGRTVSAEKLGDGRLGFSFALADGGAGLWGVRVWDSNGFSNKVETASISVVRDAPPEVRLVQPENADLKLPAFGEMPLDFEVKEDFGLSKVVLEMCVGAGAWEEAEELQVSKTGGVTWSGDRIVRFAGRDFGKAGVVRFRVKAQDTLPAEMGGPGTGLSPEIVVNLVSKNTSVARQELWSQISSANKSLDEIRKFLDRAAGHMGSAAKGFTDKNSWSANNARKVLGWAKGDVVNAEKMLSDFVDGLRDSRLESAVELFTQVLEKFLTPTRREVEDVFLTAGNAEKGEACAKCRVRIQECIAELDRARKRFADLTKAAINVQKLEDYAERMKALEEMAEEGDIGYDELAKRERELEQKFKEDFAGELNKNLSWQKKQAEQLQKRGEELAARQEALEKQAAEAKNGTEEQKKAAAAAEKKLADDINRLAAQTADLARQVEERAGSDANDDNHTAKPEWEAHSKEREAAAQAKTAADKMKDGDFEGSKENSQAVKDALQAAQDSLAEAKGRMEAKEGELAEESKEYRDMANALHDAATAADAAAKEQAEMAAEAARQQAENQQGQQQQGDPQQGQQQQGQQQQGDQQQGQQQQGQQQQGQQQQGQQQQGQQQQGQQQPQTEAQQKASQAAKNAADRLKNKAQSNADKYDLPMDRFESEYGEPGDSEGGDGEAKPDDSRSADRQNSSGAGKERRRRAERVERREDRDEGADGEDWFKMKSESGAGADAETMSDVPEEYRALVREYFNALNKGGAK